MADEDDTDTGTETAEDDVTSTDTDGGGEDGAQRALASERRARRAAEKALKDATAQLQAAADKDKSETQRLQDAAAGAERRAEEAEQRLLRIEVGADKGLSVAQAKRLVGATREELEADADELLATFGGSAKETAAEDKPKPRPGGKPTEKLRPGAAPESEPKVDPGKLAASILERPF
ncbi:hypothetical protein [Parafrankia discariae]|uniref:hypothetical protein n=1 Tax=Parafrankia discariae TaxID=365528 RepID=UPI0003756EAC|nr:hypothetical protein [Parafrankia discariae]